MIFYFIENYFSYIFRYFYNNGNQENFGLIIRYFFAHEEEHYKILIIFEILGQYNFEFLNEFVFKNSELRFLREELAFFEIIRSIGQKYFLTSSPFSSL